MGSALPDAPAGRPGEEKQWHAVESAMADIDLLGLLLQSPLGIVIHDEDGRVVAANRAFATLLGYPLDETTSLTASEVIHPLDRAQRDADAERLLSGRLQTLSTRRRLLHRDGSPVEARVYKSVLRSEDRHWVLVQLIDAREEREKLDLLEHAATHDALTDLLNRAGLIGQLDVWLATSDRLIVMLVDLDDFKDVNDTFGHAAGDRVLQQIAQRLRDAVPVGSLVSRLAGDEFVLVLDHGEIEGLTARLCESLQQPIDVGGDRCVSVSASIGAVTSTGISEPLMAIAAADRAMYEAKRGGGVTGPSAAVDGVERRHLRAEP